jgi:hypothetical protein
MKTNYNEISNRIANEQVKILYTTLSFYFYFASLLVAIGLIFVLQSIQQPHLLELIKEKNIWNVLTKETKIWFIALCVMVLYFSLVSKLYHHLSNRVDWKLWAGAIVAGLFIFGVIWGVSPALLPNEPSCNLQQLWIILFVNIGICFVQAFSSSSYLPAVYAFIFPAIFPPYPLITITSNYLKNTNSCDIYQLSFIVLNIACLACLIFASFRINSIFRTEIILRFENKNISSNIQQEINLEREAIEAQNEFLSYTAHDLRSPLAVIQNELEKILSINDIKNINVISDMQKSCLEINNLVEKLLSNSIKKSILILAKEGFPVEAIENYFNSYSIVFISSEDELITYNKTCASSPIFIICDELWENNQGIELIEMLCDEYCKDIPSLLLVENKDDFSENNNLYILQKPFSIKQLVNKTTELLSK